MYSARCGYTLIGRRSLRVKMWIPEPCADDKVKSLFSTSNLLVINRDTPISVSGVIIYLNRVSFHARG